MRSTTVSWWETHTYLEYQLAQANIGPLPLAGSPDWQALSDDNPQKLLALAVAGEHHILRMETAQESRAEASRAISACADWPTIVTRIIRLGRGHAYIARQVCGEVVA